MRQYFYTFALAIIGSLFSNYCVCQETYQLHAYSDGASNRVVVASVDLEAVTGVVIVDLTKSDFTHPESTGRVINIIDIEFSPDRSIIYFMEYYGEIFKYDIVSGTLEFLIDVSTQDLGLGYRSYAGINAIDFIDSCTLLLTGNLCATYNVCTGESLILRQYDSVVQNTADSTAIRSMTYYRGELIPLSHYGNLLSFNMEDPNSSQYLVRPDTISFADAPLFEYRPECDSSELWIEVIVDDVRWWSSVDLSTGEQELRKEVFLLSGFRRPTEIKHYPALPWGFCANYIDLDEDDDTALEEDFYFSSQCSLVDLPIADDDVILKNEEALDSIVVSVNSPLIDDALDLTAGDYTIRQGEALTLTIISETSTSNTELLSALRDLRYSYYGSAGRDDVEITVVPWYDGKAGIVATATIDLPDQLPQAGPDQIFNYCEQDSFLQLTRLIDDATTDRGGRFLDSRQEPRSSIVWHLSEARQDTIYYTVTSGGCSDTSRWILDVRDGAGAPEFSDTRLCAGDSLVVDLRDISGSVMWSDGSTNTLRVLTESGDYSLSVGVGTDCAREESFMLTIGEPAMQIDESVQICEGEEHAFAGRMLSEPGIYGDTVQSSLGCDSIRYTLTLQVSSAEELVLSGDTSFCAGASTILEILTLGDGWKWNGEPTGTLITVIEAGEYLLEGQSLDGCTLQELVVITETASPDLMYGDQLDIVFSDDLRLLPQGDTSGLTYSWSPSAGLSCDNCAAPYVRSGQDAAYTVTATTSSGCTFTTQVQVTFQKEEYYLANLLSTTSQWIENQSLYLQSRSPILYDMSIYDRWGNKIYEGRNLWSNDFTQGWQPSEETASGVYVYKVRLADRVDGVIAGDVTVLH